MNKFTWQNCLQQRCTAVTNNGFIVGHELGRNAWATHVMAVTCGGGGWRPQANVTSVRVETQMSVSARRRSWQTFIHVCTSNIATGSVNLLTTRSSQQHDDNTVIINTTSEWSTSVARWRPRKNMQWHIYGTADAHWRQPRRGCRGHTPPPNILVGRDVNGNIPPILLRTFGYSRPI